MRDRELYDRCTQRSAFLGIPQSRKPKKRTPSLEGAHKKTEATSASADRLDVWDEQLGVHTTIYLDNLSGHVA